MELSNFKYRWQNISVFVTLISAVTVPKVAFADRTMLTSIEHVRPCKTWTIPDFIAPTLWPSSPDLNSVNHRIWGKGSCRSACTAAGFMTSLSWSRVRSKIWDMSTRWSSMKLSGSDVHVFELAFEHAEDFLNTVFKYIWILHNDSQMSMWCCQ